MTWGTEATHALAPWLADPEVPRAVAVIDGDCAEVRVGAGVDPTSTFGIGSITKTMVATVLADLHLRDGLDLHTPISRLLDVPAHGEITLHQLATHTSGLPRLAPNALDHPGHDAADPYAAFTPELAIAGLAGAPRTTSGSIPGQSGDGYSNWGFQLLGLALESTAGRPLPDLLHQRIFAPLDMTGSHHRLGSSDRRRVPGRQRGHEVPRWNLLVGGPGGVECTVGDLARWACAVLEPGEDAVGRAVARAIDDDDPLAWARAPRNGWLWHNGGEAGVQSMLIVDRDAGRAVVGLAASHPDGIETAVAQVLRGVAVEPPPGPIGADDPVWDGLRSSIDALRSGDLCRIRARLADHYAADETSVGAIPGELADLGPIGATVVRLPGRPAAVTVELDDHPDDRLLVLGDDEGRIAGFLRHPAAGPPPW